MTPALLVGALLGVGCMVAAPAAADVAKCTFWAELTDDDDNGLLEFCVQGAQGGLRIEDALRPEEVGWDR